MHSVNQENKTKMKPVVVEVAFANLWTIVV